VGVVVEFLVGADRPIKEVQSDEGKSASVMSAVFPDVDPLHETHVRLKGEFTEPHAFPRPAARDSAMADQAVEIGD
jgi:hypothetical protein